MQMNALGRAVEAARSQARFAQAVGTTQQLVSYHLSRGNKVPAEWVLAAEAAFGLSRHELRPDLYPCDLRGADARSDESKAE